MFRKLFDHKTRALKNRDTRRPYAATVCGGADAVFGIRHGKNSAAAAAGLDGK